MAQKFDSVDAYVGAQPPAVREILDQIGARVREAVPGVTEVISYDIPTFKLDGKALLHVAAWKHHIAVYPVPPATPRCSATSSVSEPARARSGSNSPNPSRTSCST